MSSPAAGTRATNVLDATAAEHALQHARAVYNEGYPKRAHTLYRALLSRLPDTAAPAVRVRTLLGYSTTGYELHGAADEALLLLHEAREVARSAADDSLVVAVGGQLGLFYLRSGRAEEGIAEFDRAMAVAADADPYERCVILLNRGVARLERFAVDAAKADFAAAAEVAAESGDALREFMARHNLGYAEFVAGELPEALRDMAEAARINPGRSQPMTMLDEARVLIDAGLTTEADRALARVTGVFRRQGLTHDVAETVYARAQVALMERGWDDVRRFARAARGTFRRRGNVHWDQRAQLLELSARMGVLSDNRIDTEPVTNARLRSRRTELERIAVQASSLAVECAGANRTESARTASLIALEARAIGDDPLDLRSLHIPTVRPHDPLGTRLHIRRVRARLAWGRGDARAAARHVDAAAADLTDRRRRLASTDLRAAVAVHGVALAELDVERATRSGSAAAVFRSVERWRAFGAGVREVQPPPDDRAAELVASLRATVRSQAAVVDGGGTADRRTQLSRRRVDLEEQLRALSWQAVGADNVAAATSSGELTTALADAGQVGVLWFVGAGRLWSVTIVPDRRPALALHPLGDVAAVHETHARVRGDLEVLGRDLVPRAIRTVAAASLERGLRRLDALLLDPLQLPGSAPMLVLPPTDLTLLPWALLPSRRGIATTLAPSATRWVRATSARPHPRRPGVSVLSGPGLLHADAEAKAVATSWPGVVARSGADSTCERLETALADSTLVHVAAHGRHLTQNPLFSSLELADGPLFAYDLDAGVEVAEVVVLSACELGMSTVRPGDQSLGWTAVLLDKGARSVVSAVASVNDRVTGQVMTDLHVRLRAGVDSASALAQAQADAHARGDVAPFACFGAGVTARG